MELNKNYEIELCEDSEPTTPDEESNTNFRDKPTTNININKKTDLSKSKSKSKSKLKRRCFFKKTWLKDPKYSTFLKECQTNKYLAHCSICKSNFSIANGGTYLINRHVDQTNHKRLAETQAKENSKA